MSASSKTHLSPRPKTAAVETRDIGTVTGAVSLKGSERKSGEKKDDGKRRHRLLIPPAASLLYILSLSLHRVLGRDYRSEW